MNKKTYYQLILDQSGSMTSCADETISGFNEQLQMINDLQRLHTDQQILVSLTTFNHFVHHPVCCTSADRVQPLSPQNYRPDGSTALYDAIGESVLSLKAQAGEELDNDLASVVVIILTDGYENASKLFNLRQVRNMVRELEDTGKWTFSFLGADMDALTQAEELNIRRENAASYSKEQTESAFRSLNKSLENYIKSKDEGSISKDFLQKKDRDSEKLF
jgi:uncharacterized protein YegL